MSDKHSFVAGQAVMIIDTRTPEAPPRRRTTVLRVSKTGLLQLEDEPGYRWLAADGTRRNVHGPAGCLRVVRDGEAHLRNQVTAAVSMYTLHDSCLRWLQEHGRLPPAFDVRAAALDYALHDRPPAVAEQVRALVPVPGPV